MSYIKYRVHLTDYQTQKLRSAARSGQEVSIEIDPTKTANFDLYLTKTQINKLSKNGTSRLTLSKTQLQKNGGFIFSIPAILAGIGTAAGLAGAASNIAKAVNSRKHEKKMESEQMRHNARVENLLGVKAGKGAYLPRKYTRQGQGLKKK